MDTMEYAMEIHLKGTEELNKERIALYDYLLALGADPEKLLKLSCIDIELVIRDFRF